MQHIWSKTLLAITHGRIPPFWINFQRLTKSLHPNHQLLLSSSFFNVDRFLLQITNSTEGLLSTAVLTQIIPAPTYTIAQSLSGITLTSQFTSIHECLFVEANSKRDIWDIKKKNISFSCDTKFSQIFPKYQRLELFFENILVLFLDAIGSLPPIPGLQYTCHTDICHPDWTSGSPFVTHRYFLIFILYVSLGVQSIFLWDGVRLPEKVHTYRVVFWLVPPRKVLSMELVPPNSKKMKSSSKLEISLLKKWKSKSKPVRLKT